MKLFKRVTATLSTSMDHVVSRIEDHDAIIETAIKECRRSAAQIRVRLGKVKRDGDQLAARKRQLDNDMTRWTQRAVETAEDNQEKALICLKRKKECEMQLKQTEASIVEHTEAEKTLKQNLVAVENKLSHISQKRNTMRSRQSVSEANKILNALEGDASFDIDDTFDRWETNILETEMGRDTEVAIDSFEQTYLEQEEGEALKNELNAMLKKHQESDNE